MKTQQETQGWYVVIEGNSNPYLKSGAYLPWLDVKLPKDVDPNELKEKDLELVTKEVCWWFEKPCTKKTSLMWEKREGDIPYYELSFGIKDDNLCLLSN